MRSAFSAVSPIGPSSGSIWHGNISELIAVAPERVAVSSRRISQQSRLDFRRPASPRFSSAPFFTRRRGGVIIKPVGFLSHNAATDEALERTQMPLVFWRDKADGIADGVRSTCPANSMHVILRVHGKVVIHHMRDAVDINAAGSDVSGDKDAHCARFEIL